MHHLVRLAAAALAMSLAACAADVSEPAREPLPEGVEVVIDEPLVLMDEVRIPSDDPALVEVLEDEGGWLRFRYHAPPTVSFRVGDVLVGNEGAGYMGRVLELAEDGLERRVRLDPVGLDEVLAEGAFTAYVTPEESDFRPVAADDGVGGRRDALFGSFDLVPTEILDGAGHCEGVGYGQIRFRHQLQTEGLDSEFTFERDGLFGVGKAGVTVRGGATLRLEVLTSGAVDAACTLDVIDALNRAGIGIRPVEFATRFRLAGILPVSVAFQMTPVLTTDATVFVEPTTMSAALMVGADLTAGVLYERGSGVRIISSLDRRAGFDLDLEEGGDANARIDVHGGLFFRLDVNRLQLPQAGAELDGLLRFSATGAACSYDWEAAVSGEVWLRGPVGVDLGFFSRTFAELNESRGFTARAAGGEDLDLPWCEEDMCTTDDDCVGIDETCEDGVCVEGGPTCDCAEGETCVGDRCLPELATCESCTAEAGMAWCPGSASCMPEGEASCGGELITNRSACDPCEHATCEECATSGFCGWVRSEGRCVNDRLHRDDYAPEDYVSTPGWCG